MPRCGDNEDDDGDDDADDDWLVQSHEWIRVRIQQMEPDLMEVGSTLEEAKQLRREHDELLTKLNVRHTLPDAHLNNTEWPPKSRLMPSFPCRFNHIHLFD